MILYHGTSASKGRQIEKHGFITDKTYNWDVHSKKGYVYLSYSYAPFYAMTAKNKKSDLALVKVEVKSKDLYPDDDFLMLALFNKNTYTQVELDKVSLEKYKYLAKKSLEYLGNVAVKVNIANKGIKGIRYFDGSKLFYKVDPSITPLNYKFMGKYYHELTEWIYQGKNFLEFKGDIFGFNGRV